MLILWIFGTILAVGLFLGIIFIFSLLFESSDYREVPFSHPRSTVINVTSDMDSEEILELLEMGPELKEKICPPGSPKMLNDSEEWRHFYS